MQAATSRNAAFTSIRPAPFDPRATARPRPAFTGHVINRAWRGLIVLSLVVPTLAGLSPRAHASDDAYSARQWALRRVGAEKAWGTGSGKGAVIAVIDSGVDVHHEDLKGAFVGGRDFVEDDNDPSDEFGHGTHVAGIAAARANNDIGVAGVAPDVKIMPLRVLDEGGSGSTGDVNAAIHWAVDHGADVVNLSLSDGVTILNLFGSPLTKALNYAWSKGVVPVIASGNDASFRTQMRTVNALIVTATGPNDGLAPYANSVGFADWGIAAPGGTNDNGNESMVYSTIWDKQGRTHYGWGMGTSMAAPHVAGAAAILRGLGLSPQQTVNRLMQTAEDVGPAGYDSTYGAGRLDVAAAVAGLRPKARPTAAAATITPSTDAAATDAPTAAPAPDTAPPTAPSTSSGAEPSATVTVDPGPSTSTPDVRAIAGDDRRPTARNGVLTVLAFASALAALGSAAGLTFVRRRSAPRT
jgi:subtilisin family serine protease